MKLVNVGGPGLGHTEITFWKYEIMHITLLPMKMGEKYMVASEFYR